jgi:hypothetical protein
MKERTMTRKKFKRDDVVIAAYGISGTDEHGAAVTLAGGEKVRGDHFLVPA